MELGCVCDSDKAGSLQQDLQELFLLEGLLGQLAQFAFRSFEQVADGGVSRYGVVLVAAQLELSIVHCRENLSSLWLDHGNNIIGHSSQN